MTKEFLMMKPEWQWSGVGGILGLRISSFFRHSSFVIRHLLFTTGLAASAFAAEKESTQPATNAVVVPFEFHRDHVMVRVSVNHSEPLLFMLDTGYAMNMISPEQAKALEL